MNAAANPLDTPPAYLHAPISDMMLEVVVIPVSDVERARRFHGELLDHVRHRHHDGGAGFGAGPAPGRGERGVDAHRAA